MGEGKEKHALDERKSVPDACAWAGQKGELVTPYTRDVVRSLWDLCPAPRPVHEKRVIYLIQVS